MNDATPAELAVTFTASRDGLTHAELVAWGDQAARVLADAHSPVVSRAVRVEWGTALRGADDEHGQPTIWDPVRIRGEEQARAAAGPNVDGTETIVPVWRILETDWFDASDEHGITTAGFVPRADYDDANDRANQNFDIVGQQHTEIARLRDTVKKLVELAEDIDAPGSDGDTLVAEAQRIARDVLPPAKAGRS